MNYKLNIEQLSKLCRDFQADCHDGFVSNDKVYIDEWLSKNKAKEIEIKSAKELFKRMKFMIQILL